MWGCSFFVEMKTQLPLQYISNQKQYTLSIGNMGRNKIFEITFIACLDAQ